MTAHSQALATTQATVASSTLVARTSQLFRQLPADRPTDGESISRLGSDLARILASDHLLITCHRDRDAVVLFADGPDADHLRRMQRCAAQAVLGKNLPDRWFTDGCGPGDLLTTPVATSLGPISVTVLFNRIEEGTRDARREMAAHILPLLHSFLSLWSERFASSQRLHGLTAALDKGDVGVALVGRDGRLIFANVAAETLMVEADGIRRVNGVLCGTRLADTLRLQAAVEHVIAVASTPQAARPTVSPVLALPRRSKRPLMAAVVACDDAAELRDDPMAIVYLFDPEEDLQLLIEPVCKHYGLSPVETRLTCLLADGSSLGEAAERIHVREQTARSYLKQIFLKTDTNRQAELVWLMLKSSVRTAPGCRTALI